MSGSPAEIARACLPNLSEALGIARDLGNVVEIGRFERTGFQHERLKIVL
jgi:hypothetical protein